MRCRKFQKIDHISKSVLKLNKSTCRLSEKHHGDSILQRKLKIYAENNKATEMTKSSKKRQNNNYPIRFQSSEKKLLVVNVFARR